MVNDCAPNATVAATVRVCDTGTCTCAANNDVANDCDNDTLRLGVDILGAGVGEDEGDTDAELWKRLLDVGDSEAVAVAG